MQVQIFENPGGQFFRYELRMEDSRRITLTMTVESIVHAV